MMDKDYLIKRYNWFQRIQTYPPENWDRKTKIDFYGQFINFLDTVEHCGYQFVHHSEKEGDKYISIATDLILTTEYR